MSYPRINAGSTHPFCSASALGQAQVAAILLCTIQVMSVGVSHTAGNLLLAGLWLAGKAWLIGRLSDQGINWHCQQVLAIKKHVCNRWGLPSQHI